MFSVNRRRGGQGSTSGKLSSDILENEKLLKGIFQKSSDVVINVFKTAKDKAMVAYIDGLVNKDLIDRDIIKPLKAAEFDGDVSGALKAVYTEAETLDEAAKQMLDGNVAVLYEKSRTIWIIEFKGWDQRSVEEPASESTIRGPREGFNENIRTGTALLRRKIKNPKLIIESLILGEQSNTSIALAYVEGIVNTEVLEEVRKRLSKIDVGSILETGYIEQYIEENALSPISGIGLTQKPDIAAMKILEGRIAILCDGTPHALVIPEMFIENIQTSEDYYSRPIYGSFLRLSRILGLALTVMLPGLFIAITTYNQGMLPSIFLRNIIASTQKTPMPIAAEIFLLTVLFELLKEAGTRLPKAVGSAITIVGSLIIGEAAVNAGIVSEPSVIIVAISAVTSFITPNLVEFTLVYRAVFWLLGSMMGVMGIGAAYFIMLTQLISTSSFGIPILSSFSKSEMKDSVIRFPLKALKYRPMSVVKDNIKRNDFKNS